MSISDLILANAAGAAQPTSPMGGAGGTIFFMAMIFGVMYLFLILPQQRQTKKRNEMLASLGKGDKVVTSGGICGTIVGMSERTIVLKVSDDPVTKIEFVKQAVSQVSSSAGEAKDS